jgi:hypothetical protein
MIFYSWIGEDVLCLLIEMEKAKQGVVKVSNPSMNSSIISVMYSELFEKR